MTEPDRVVHDETGSRYVLMRGDREIGFTEYRLRDDAIVFVHTEVDATLQERGLGSKLVAGALDHVRGTRTERVGATCPFVRRYLDTHPEYGALETR